MPPWSMPTSMKTEPGRIDASMRREISLGESAPGCSTAPTTRSDSRTAAAIASGSAGAVTTRSPQAARIASRRVGERPSTRTDAPRSAASSAASRATTPAPTMVTLAPRDAIDCRKQHAPTAAVGHEQRRADEWRQASGDARHRRQQRQAPAGAGDGFVRDARDARREHGVLQRAIASKLREAEHGGAGAERRELDGLQFLDLDDQRARVDARGVGLDDRAARSVGGVVEADARACIALDDHLVPCGNERADIFRNEADATLAVLALTRNADAHQRPGGLRGLAEDRGDELALLACIAHRLAQPGLQDGALFCLVRLAQRVIAAQSVAEPAQVGGFRAVARHDVNVQPEDLPVVLDRADAHGPALRKDVPGALSLKSHRIERIARLGQGVRRVERRQVHDTFAGTIRDRGAADVLGVHPRRAGVDQVDDALRDGNHRRIVFHVCRRHDAIRQNRRLRQALPSPAGFFLPVIVTFILHMSWRRARRRTNRIMSVTTQLSTPLSARIVDALENAVSGVPASRQRAVEAPARAARALARKAAAKAATLSGALALPPGALGMLTVLPDLVAIWRIQAQLVSDIAGLYGKDLQLTRSHMVYCLFRHAATQFTRDVVVRTGQRLMFRQLSGGALKSVLSGIGMSVTQRVAGTTASRWVPVVGAAAVAGYAYYDTLQVAKTAINLLETPALVSPD